MSGRRRVRGGRWEWRKEERESTGWGREGGREGGKAGKSEGRKDGVERKNGKVDEQ